MAYQVMARARRPEVFEAVVAQDHIVHTLQNAIRAERIAHAYLFSGPRGTGKTTTARLLAKALNCENGPTADPCGACASCLAIKGGRSMDVREIDGASTGLVEDVRQLREEVGYAASKGKRKVYIIDEVHMLSTAAFNALLKTLEEPPPHVVFVFATTEPNKVPDTILSRCQRYNFRRIPTSAIVDELKRIVEEQKIVADEEALYLIGRKADGAMRDALSIMDQVLSISETGVEAETVRDLLGIVPRELYFQLTDAVHAQDSAQALQLISELVDGGGDVGEFTEGLLEHFRHLLVARVEGEVIGADLPESDLARYKEAAVGFEERDLLRMLNTVADLELNLGRVSEPRFWLELTAMKLIQAATSVELQELVARLDRLQGPGGPGHPGPAAGPPPEPTAGPPSIGQRPRLPRPSGAGRKGRAGASTPAPKPREPDSPPSDEGGRDDDAQPDPAAAEPAARKPAAAAAVDEPSIEDLPRREAPTVEAIRDRWEDIVNHVRETRVSIGTFLAESAPRSLDDDQLVVVFKRTRDFHANRVRQNKDAVEEAVKVVVGFEVSVTCEVDYDLEPEDVKEERRVEEDERVQLALRIFGGDIIRR